VLAFGQETEPVSRLRKPRDIPAAHDFRHMRSRWFVGRLARQCEGDCRGGPTLPAPSRRLPGVAVSPPSVAATNVPLPACSPPPTQSSAPCPQPFPDGLSSAGP